MRKYMVLLVLLLGWLLMATVVFKFTKLPWNGYRVTCISKGQVVFRGMAQRVTSIENGGCVITEAGTNQTRSCDVCK